MLQQQQVIEAEQPPAQRRIQENVQQIAQQGYNPKNQLGVGATQDDMARRVAWLTTAALPTTASGYKPLINQIYNVSQATRDKELAKKAYDMANALSAGMIQKIGAQQVKINQNRLKQAKFSAPSGKPSTAKEVIAPIAGRNQAADTVNKVKEQNVNNLLTSLTSAHNSILHANASADMNLYAPPSMTRDTTPRNTNIRAALLAAQPKKTTSLTQILIRQRGNINSAAWSAKPYSSWDPKTKQWFLMNSKGQLYAPKAPKKATQLSANQYLQKGIDLSVAGSSQTPFFGLMQKKLVDMGYAPMGAINGQSLTLYLGRYRDPVTNKVKLIKRPSYIYNKYDYVATLDHHILTAAYKWNQYVRAQQQVLNFMRKKTSWQAQTAKNKTRQTSTAQMNRNVMLSSANSISKGTWPPYVAATAQQKAELLKTVNNYDWQQFSLLVEQIASRFLQNNPNLPSLQLKRWQTWANISEQGAYRAYKNTKISQLAPQQAIFDTKQNRNKIYNNDDFYNTEFSQQIGLISDFRRKKVKRVQGPRKTTATVSLSSLQAAVEKAKKQGVNVVRLTNDKALKGPNGLGQITQAQQYGF